MAATLTTEVKPGAAESQEKEKQIYIDKLRTEADPKAFWGATGLVASGVSLLLTAVTGMEAYIATNSTAKVEWGAAAGVFLVAMPIFFVKGKRTLEAWREIDKQIKRLTKAAKNPAKNSTPQLRT